MCNLRILNATEVQYRFSVSCVEKTGPRVSVPDYLKKLELTYYWSSLSQRRSWTISPKGPDERCLLASATHPIHITHGQIHLEHTHTLGQLPHFILIVLKKSVICIVIKSPWEWPFRCDVIITVNPACLPWAHPAQYCQLDSERQEREG